MLKRKGDWLELRFWIAPFLRVLNFLVRFSSSLLLYLSIHH